MLERQQDQPVSGLQVMCSRLQRTSLWEGAPLCENGDEPLTHDILAALDLLEPREDGSDGMEPFEDTLDKSVLTPDTQARCPAHGHVYLQTMSLRIWRGRLRSTAAHHHLCLHRFLREMLVLLILRQQHPHRHESNCNCPGRM